MFHILLKVLDKCRAIRRRFHPDEQEKVARQVQSRLVEFRIAQIQMFIIGIIERGKLLITLRLAHRPNPISHTVATTLVGNPDLLPPQGQWLILISLGHGTGHYDLVLTDRPLKRLAGLAVEAPHLKDPEIIGVYKPDETDPLHIDAMKRGELIPIPVVKMVEGIANRLDPRVGRQALDNRQEIRRRATRMDSGRIEIRASLGHDTQLHVIDMPDIEPKRTLIFLIFNIKVIGSVEKTNTHHQQLEEDERIRPPLIPYLS